MHAVCNLADCYAMQCKTHASHPQRHKHKHAPIVSPGSPDMPASLSSHLMGADWGAGTSAANRALKLSLVSARFHQQLPNSRQ